MLTINKNKYTSTYLSMERENMILIVDLSEGTTGRQERKKE
jgi:hypothetical protein